MEEQLLNLTEELLTYNQLCLKYFQEVRETQKEQDFYQVVKPFADKVKSVKDEWQVMMKDWVEKKSPKHIHRNQIETISDHIERNSIQAFFPGTSKALFLNANRTIKYFLEEVIKEINH
ncbi:DUF1798 family protein [Neobacillus dielmonensis]|uniref:DUF1798 family protein n=1 Tax=Neobacillus dielmonensis TaxID=1347369 RepID=UPI0005AB1A45|nr:DUF1798 family protein [Neobacillus dielmonensis]